MFGVFDGYEQQLLSDWIWAGAATTQTVLATNRFRRRPSAGAIADAANTVQSGATVEQVIAHHSSEQPTHGGCAEVHALFEQLAGIDTKAKAFTALAGLLSPANHPTPAGLAATRLVADLFNR